MRGYMVHRLEYLLGISYVEETEVFKVCLDYWNHLVCELFQSECNVEPQQFGFHMGGSDTMPPSARKQLYSMPMSRLRLLMVRAIPGVETVYEYSRRLRLDYGK